MAGGNTMIQGLLVLVLGAVVTTQVVDVFKPVLPEVNKISFYLSVVIGIVVAFSLNVDIFVTLGFAPAVPFIGVIFAGLIMSQGANLVHDFVKKIKGIQEPVEVDYHVRDAE